MLTSVVVVVQFGCWLHCIHNYGFEITMCVGPSMRPTFNNAGDIVVVERVTPRWGTLEKGDVVIARSPQNPEQTVCKRIRAFGGELVKVNTGAGAGGTFSRTSRYGSRSGNHSGTIKLPPGHVWLEGDNPSDSTDSRMYGPVPEALITGRVVCKIWPPSEAKWVGRTQEVEELPPQVRWAGLRKIGTALFALRAIRCVASQR
jgi:signal peptidase I